MINKLTLEQHRFDLCGSTYMHIFSIAYTILLLNPWYVQSIDVEPQIQGKQIRRGIAYREGQYKLYMNYQLHIR